MIDTLLLNFLFLHFPVLLFLIFFENRSFSYNKYIFVFLASIPMVLCMAFPIDMINGFIFDFRYVPFVIVALYGGYKFAFPLYIVLNIYRLIIGGEGVLPSFLFSTTIFAILPYFSQYFIKLTSKKRIICATIASFLTILFYLATLTSFFQEFNQEFWAISLYALVTYVIVSTIIMVLIEKIIYNSKAREALLRAERIDDISELSASVSHEIKNPLTVTSGFLQLLNQSETITADEKRYIQFSLLELKRAEKIVNDFIAFAKPQSENMVYSNFKEETEYVKNIITPYANMHRVDIEFYFDNDLKTYYDKNQVQQCLINLYKNGVESMKQSGGTLYVSVTEQRKTIVFEVSDQGDGMTQEEIMTLGRPYYSTKKEGTGLGMLMIYSTVNKLKGKIEVSSEKGKGTTFMIAIPVQKPTL
ncbi:sensor histidine kinase [Bacillus horti]|uniref:histidine kinase n=1 Tax=Caldalkalibacillus horti TaxID=77523 RepID=A0ABT9VX94_9BACI|nr:HAMP domain-containing sensor histidine kinase [Bacillus horti]MDQ0165609.1 two-component system sporulation sensor kinase B [Bacillus horti]